MKAVLVRMLMLGIALAAGLISSIAVATTVMPLSLNEAARAADAIVVGTITGHQSRWGDSTQRWMQTDYTLAVEDIVYPSEQGVSIGKTIILTYWGGTIGGETQEVADIRQPADGEQLVMLLHSRWNQEGSVAPTVGFNYGLFSIAGSAVSGNRVVRDAAGQPLALATSGQIVRGSVAPAAATGSIEMNLGTFKGWLRNNVSSIKAMPAIPKPAVDPNDPRLMKIITQSPAPADAIPPSSSWMIANSVAPAQGSAAEAGAGVPPAVSATDTTPSLPTSASDELPVTHVLPKWSTNHQAHLPIVVNQFPSSFGSYYSEDQYQMSKWNYYASNVFRVFTTPTGTYNWGNGVFDMAGWMNDAQRQSIYGSTWYCGAGCTGLAVTFMRYDSGGWIIEADIALNSGVNWTLDDEWVFDGGAAIGFRQSMIHELGHMHGLNHNFGFPALMNYFEPGNYRDFAMPFMDDAIGIRFEYSANTVARTDLAAYLYSENGICYDGTSFFNCITEATYPSTVVAGQSLTVNNYHVENVGTTTISTPTIEWYLTAARNFSSATYSLGSSTYPALNTATYFTPSTVGRILAVPANVPAGSYYLAAYIRGDGGAFQVAFPFSNNYAFSLKRISVAVPPSVPTIGTAVAGNASISVAFTPGALGSGTLNYYTANCGGITHTGSGSPITVSGLTSGTSYTCKVNTTTTVGTSAWSGVSNSVTTLTRQSIVFGAAPSITVGGTGSVSATGGASGQPVIFSSLTTGICTVSGSTVSGVAAGTCTIAANQAGNGSYSAAPQITQSFSIAGVPPGPPTIRSITAGSGSATIHFSAPSNTGGWAISRYAATCAASGQITRSASASSSPLSVRNLTGGVLYQCALTATNSGGLTSTASAALPVMPAPGKKSSLTPILLLLLD